jgi:hypothetical protein
MHHSMSIIRGRAIVLALAATVASVPAFAIEAGGIRFEDKVSVGGMELVANGAGVRTRFVFDVYAMTLYLPAKAATAESALAAKPPRRVALQLMRDVKATDFVDALKAGMQANLSEAEFAALKPQVQQFSDIIAAGGEVKKGTQVSIDDVPGAGTRVSIGGKPQGKDIAGEAFYNALLKIWLGEKPVQADLKAKLLGK